MTLKFQRKSREFCAALFGINNHLVHVLWKALRYQLLLKSVCVLQTARVCTDGSRKQKAKQAKIKWLHLEYVVLSSSSQPAVFFFVFFFFAVMLLVQRLITRTDECPDLLVANWEGQAEGGSRGLSPALWCVSTSGYLWAAMLSIDSQRWKF